MVTCAQATIKAWVADLAAYNAGSLEGFWMDCTDDADEIPEQIAEFLGAQTEKHGELREEYAVFDWEGMDFHTEHPDWEEVAAFVGLAEEHGLGMAEAAQALDISPDDAEDYYHGTCETFREYAEQLAEDIYSEEELGPVANYIDWDAFAPDLEMDYRTHRGDADGMVHVFDA